MSITTKAATLIQPLFMTLNLGWFLTTHSRILKMKTKLNCENNPCINEIENLTSDTDLVIKQNGAVYLHLDEGKDRLVAHKNLQINEIETTNFDTDINTNDFFFNTTKFLVCHVVIQMMLLTLASLQI